MATNSVERARHAGFAIVLDGSGCKTRGVALVNKIRMLDLKACKARKVERVAPQVIEDALARLQALIEAE